MFQSSLGYKHNPISKINKAKRAGGMAQVVESLPSKFRAMSSNPSTTKKKKRINDLKEDSNKQISEVGKSVQDLNKKVSNTDENSIQQEN
jgi:hypothetical protein